MVNQASPLVLISGLLSNACLWQHQLQHLSDIAAISVFNPSQDETHKMVEAILEAAPEKFALAGHSMGGWLCLEILRVAPSRVLKVCLLNTTARNDSQEKRTRREAMIERCLDGQFVRVVNELTNFLTHNENMKEQVKNMFLDVGCQTFINQEKAMLNRKPSMPILPTIRCPTLVIHAAQDKNFCFEEQVELVEQIPHARLAIIDDSGHMSPLEMPQAVTALLRFWLNYF